MRKESVLDKNRSVLLILSFLLILILSCSVSTGENSGNQTLVQTQTAMNVQLTMIALDTNSQKEQQTQSLQATQVAQSAQATVLAFQSNMATQGAVQNQQNAVQNQAVQPQNPPVVQQNQPAQQSQSGAQPAPAGAAQPVAQAAIEPFDTWKTKASILLYEDMTGVLDNNRTVKDALESLGIKPTRDEKDASGFFLGDIRAGGPGGKPWDLIISASEVRTAIQGEFIPPLNEAVTAGSSLIMEQWNLDSINFGKISTLMTRCGVSLQKDKAYNPAVCEPPRTYEGGEYPLVLWAIDGTSPILHEPNEGLRLASMSEYWTDWYERQCLLGAWPGPWDYGDELQLTSGSKSKIILGTKTTDTDRHGMLVSCQDGRVSLWTSSTHNYANDRVLPLWMNMIHNALKARWGYLSKQ